jgi:hypothetical protein
MGATKAEIQAEIERLNAELAKADDDDDVELLVERDGTRATLKGRHARSFLKKLGLDDDGAGDQGDGDQGDGDQGDGDGSDGDQDVKPPAGNRFFR